MSGDPWAIPPPPGLGCTPERWHELIASSGDEVDLYLEWDAAEGDLDLVLRDALGAEVARGIPGGFGDALIDTLPADGGWFVEVEMIQDLGVVPGSSYALYTGVSGFP